MQRFFTLIVLFLVSLPVGISISGCEGSNVDANFCNGKGYGQKLGQVDSIDLEPAVNGISLAYGQTSVVTTPVAHDCRNTTASVARFTYGTTNLGMADISPTGAICGGSWNRNSPGGITDFTICTPPAHSGTAFITATAAGVTSNPVQVFVHPPLTGVSLSLASPTSCYSQNSAPVQLDATAYVEGSSTPFCAPASANLGVPECKTNLGRFTYTPVTAGIVSIDANGLATAKLPGSTAISATISSVSSTAGYWFTCPPKSIALSVPANVQNSDGSINVNPGIPVPLTATVTDTNNQIISGLTLNVTSTNPQQVTATSSAITAAFGGTSTVTVSCEPTTCNPAPANLIGTYADGSTPSGTGTPVLASTSLIVKSTGNSSQKLWMGSSKSYFFTPVDLTTGTVGNPVKLPYQPNSMVMDQAGNNLFFGSYRELMQVSAVTGTVSKQDTNVPGVVLAVSPDASTVLINDQVRRVLYLYTVNSGAYSAFGGVAQQAQFSLDGNNVYATGTDYTTGKTTLYEHNIFTGWSASDKTAEQGANACVAANNYNNAPAGFGSPNAGGAYNPFCAPSVAVTVPSAGAFVSGAAQTSANSFCYNKTVAPGQSPNYPPAATVAAVTDQVAASPDGNHILGASATNQTFTDIGVTIPTGECPPVTGPPQAFTTTPVSTALGVTASTIDQVLVAPDSSVAFVTYQAPGTGTGLLPAYKLGAKGSLGTLSTIKLAGSAEAPISGVFAPNNAYFFTGTSGDNLVHFISLTDLTDSKQIDPKLVDPNGNPVPAEFITVKSRPTS